MDLDQLAESARNRGLKLVRSRIRTPGKGDYGKAGLTDAAGKPLFGIAGKTLTATPEEVQEHLRKLEVGDWGASLSEADKQQPKVKPRAKPAANDDAAPSPKAKPPKPKPAPKPAVRAARAKDAPHLLKLVALLGYRLGEKAFAKRLQHMINSDCTPLVATLGDEVIGLCGLQVSTMLQRERPVGRITILVVAEEHRGQAIGRLLVEAAEEYFRAAGCELVEVTSNDRHLHAHAFYRRVGYERTSIRFAKTL